MEIILQNDVNVKFDVLSNYLLNIYMCITYFCLQRKNGLKNSLKKIRFAGMNRNYLVVSNASNKIYYHFEWHIYLNLMDVQ